MRQVMDAAAALGIREFDIFRLAWCRWSGEEADEKMLESHFADYMFRQVAPPWVRHFCRQVLAQETEGRLNPEDFGADRVPRREPAPRLGRVSVGLILAVMLVIYPALLSFTDEPQTTAPFSCEMGPGMQVFAGLAHALAGREPPACLWPATEPSVTTYRDSTSRQPSKWSGDDAQEG